MPRTSTPGMMPVLAHGSAIRRQGEIKMSPPRGVHTLRVPVVSPIIASGRGFHHLSICSEPVPSASR